MKRYIGVKIIDAKPATNVESAAIRQGFSVEEMKEHYQKNKIAEREGYHVEYPDGYQSWSPKEVFEEAYRECDYMTFGLAIEAMKKGHKVARKGWNGKGMFIYIQDGSKVETGALRSVAMLEYCKSRVIQHVKINPHIDMKAADGSLVIGWLASQTDMLAEDWVIVE